MNMKFQIVNLLILVWMFSSCSVYQYALVESDLPKNEFSEFVVENDSLVLKFSFKGENLPVNIEVYNKLDKPLYLDWKRSSVVINDKSYLLKKDVTQVELTSQTISVNDHNTINSVYSYGSLSGNLINQGLESFIPPKASIAITPCHLRSEFFDPPASVAEERITVPGLSSPVNLRRHQFNRENTPMFFRLYLTMSYSNDFQEPVFFDQLFYISELSRSYSSENELLMKSANRSYISKVSNFGGVLGVIAISCLAVVGLVAGINQAP